MPALVTENIANTPDMTADETSILDFRYINSHCHRKNLNFFHDMTEVTSYLVKIEEQTSPEEKKHDQDSVKGIHHITYISIPIFLLWLMYRAILDKGK